jgi:hypothetical protein
LEEVFDGYARFNAKAFDLMGESGDLRLKWDKCKDTFQIDEVKSCTGLDIVSLVKAFRNGQLAILVDLQEIVCVCHRYDYNLKNH